MSDTKQLKPGTDGVPEQVYGQIETADFLSTIDTSDGYRIKVVNWENVAKTILGGKTIGGPGNNDITTNSGIQTLRDKTLIDPVIKATFGTDEEELDEEVIYKLGATMKALDTAGYNDGIRLVETVNVTPKQNICAIINASSDSSSEIALTPEDLYDAAGLDHSIGSIDIRSMLISVWDVSSDEYTQKNDWSVVATAETGTSKLASMILTMHSPSHDYSIGISYRLADEA